MVSGEAVRAHLYYRYPSPRLALLKRMKKNRNLRNNLNRNRTHNRRNKQLELFPKELRFFGGRFLHEKRKGRRPLSTREPIHLVMRSSWAKGAHSFTQPRNKKAIESLIHTLAQKYGVRVYRKAIEGNHLHFILRIHNRETYKSFVRVLSGKIASHIMKGKSFANFLSKVAGDGAIRALKAGPESDRALSTGDGSTRAHETQGKGQRFWQFRPFSRVMSWGRDFMNGCKYVIQNTLEASGFIPYKPRRNHYAPWTQPWIEKATCNSKTASVLIQYKLTRQQQRADEWAARA
jgi:REP element-mobilizing transposase RayT